MHIMAYIDLSWQPDKEQVNSVGRCREWNSDWNM